MKIIFNLSGALATVIGGIVVMQFGFQYLFIGMAALAVFSCIGVLLKPRRLL